MSSTRPDLNMRVKKPWFRAGKSVYLALTSKEV